MDAPEGEKCRTSRLNVFQSACQSDMCTNSLRFLGHPTPTMSRFVGIVLALAAFAVAAPPLSVRQSITTLSTAQISAFRPYTFYASAGYCTSASTLTWNCGVPCAANPTFKPVASGGDGTVIQFWFVGYDPTLETVIVSHQGTDPEHILPLLTDANFILEPLNPLLFPGLSPSVLVHSGFADEHAATATDVLAAVKNATTRFGATKVTMVGHSLGGALSLIESVYLPLHVTGVTFQTILYGLPRVGNQEFADLASAGNTVTHINNMEDPIPILPPTSSLPLESFHHPTGEIHIQARDSGDWDSCPGEYSHGIQIVLSLNISIAGEDNISPLCSTGDVTVTNGNLTNHDGPYDGVEMGNGCV
ncbi:Lipase-3 domain-containing protein [Mycena venus]|uniref:Lipase-3 domain-containing protein n=1 Tax=Mycena venus TaxID=2733690 RepID=A0A8H6X4B0_9AGAR|nr:Lipase-3 domain-containing protein [Mycena venus]